MYWVYTLLVCKFDWHFDPSVREDIIYMCKPYLSPFSFSRTRAALFVALIPIRARSHARPRSPCFFSKEAKRRVKCGQLITALLDISDVTEALKCSFAQGTRVRLSTHSSGKKMGPERDCLGPSRGSLPWLGLGVETRLAWPPTPT